LFAYDNFCTYPTWILPTMSHSLEKDVAPLVDHYHGLASQAKLSSDDIQKFSTKLEHMFQSIQTPARHVHVWHYTPDDSSKEEENTLGNSGIDPFPPQALVSPTSEDEIIAIVKKAYAARTQVRVIGAAHSSPSNIILDAPHGNFPPNVALITLTKYRGVSIDKEKQRATVKAGTNLDVDPEVSDSTEANSLARQLQAAGFALPETGGITHQTVGGFLSTGKRTSGVTYHSLANLDLLGTQDPPEARSYMDFMMLFTVLPSSMALEPNIYYPATTPIPPSFLPQVYQLAFAES
jgi:FAD binding domain